MYNVHVVQWYMCTLADIKSHPTTRNSRQSPSPNPRPPSSRLCFHLSRKREAMSSLSAFCVTVSFPFPPRKGGTNICGASVHPPSLPTYSYISAREHTSSLYSYKLAFTATAAYTTNSPSPCNTRDDIIYLHYRQPFRRRHGHAASFSFLYPFLSPGRPFAK